MSEYVVKVRLTANTPDNPEVSYYNNLEPRSIFTRYVSEGKLRILLDQIADNSREIWYVYENKEVRDQLKEEVSVFDSSYKNDVTVDIIEEGPYTA